MKKFLVVLIVILLGFLSYIAYYYLTKTEKEVLILVPQKRYSFYYDEDQIMNIPIFTNNQNIINSFSDIASISNLDNSIKLMLDNISINYLYNYLHEDEILSHYELS